MSLFSSIAAFFRRLAGGQSKKEEEWASRIPGDSPIAKPSNLIPLDPEDPWRT
jgi:hypothetical protein